MIVKGIIYIMTTAVPGLIKIGSTSNFEQRMYDLEHDGYQNVTALKRSFAIEVDEYIEKEFMLQNIFEKSRLPNTELFALDVNIATQLLSSFDGKVIFPKTETKDGIFVDATDNTEGEKIPDGTYTFQRKKMSNNKVVRATAVINNGRWTLKKGSVLGIVEGVGVSQKAKSVRATMPLDSNGKLLDDFELGACSPSHAGIVVMNQSDNGWIDWKNAEGQPVDIYRKKKDWIE